MKKRIDEKTRSCTAAALLLVLCLLTALLFTGCGGKKDGGVSSDGSEKTVSVTLEVTGESGEKKSYPVTAKEGDTLLSAMRQAGILEEDGIRDGMVYTLSGETADYNEDKSYWAFYRDGEYMMTGAGETVLEDGATYSFVRTFEE